MDLIKTFSKNIFAFGFGRGLRKFIGIFLMPFYTRALTTDDYGILETLGVSIFLLIAILNVGLDSASGRYFFMAKTEEEKGKVLFTVLVFRLVTIIPCLILSLFSDKISLVLFETDAYTWVVFLSILMIPLNLLYSEQEHIFRYYFEPWKFNFITIAKLLSSVGLGITLVVILKKGVWGAQLNGFLSALFFFLLSYLLYNRKRYTYQFSWYWGKKLLSYGSPLIFATAALWIYTSADRYFLLYYKNLTDIGIFSVGAKLTQIMGILAAAVQMSWGPLVMSVYESDESEEKVETKTFLISGWHLFLIVSLSIVLFISIFGPAIIDILAPPAYRMGVLVIPFLALAKVLSQSIQMTSSGIEFFEKTKHFAWIIPLCAAINIGLNFYFIPKFSYVGAAFTTFLANLVQILITYNISQKYFYVDRKIKNVFFYGITIGLLSIFFPFSELIYHIDIPFLLKLLALAFGIFAPVLFGLIKLKTIINMLRGIRSYVS